VVVIHCFVFSPVILIGYGALAILMPSPNEELAENDLDGEPTNDAPTHRHHLFAWALIGIGVFVVVSKVGIPHPGNGWLLPLALVGIGVALLTRRSRLN
jgi:hypothetical protein